MHKAKTTVARSASAALPKIVVRMMAVLLFLSTVALGEESHGAKSTALVDEAFAAFHQALSASASEILASPQPPLSGSRWPLSERSNLDPKQLLTIKAEDPGSHARPPQEALPRVQALLPVLQPILREERVPTELAAVVFVESGGRADALSSKGALGLWQLMPETARRYGLTVARERDERLDIYKSTRAAARYLRDLYGKFGDWRLALAAYNAGEDLVQRAVVGNRTNDFLNLSNGHLLPLETVRYVPAVMDAMKMFGNRGSTIVPTHNFKNTRIFYADAQLGN